MADSEIEVTEGSGKEVDTRTTPGGQHRQVVVLGDPDANDVIDATDLITHLQSIANNTDGLEGFVDGLETLLTSLQTLMTTISGNVDGLEGFTDGIEGLLTTIRDNADTLETKLQSIIDNTDGLEGFVDGIEALLTTTRDNADTVETKLQSIIDQQTSGAQKTRLTDGTDDLPIGPVTANTGDVSASGDTTIVSVSAGFKIKLYHISFVPDPASANNVKVIIKIGSTAKYTWRCNKAGSGFSRSPKSGQGWVEGADGEDLVLNQSVAADTSWNAEYDIVAV